MAIEGDITMRKTQYVKELNDVRNQTNAATKEMENGFKRYGTSINKAGIAMRYVSAEMGAGAVAFGRAFQVLAGGKIAVAVAAITGAFVGLKKIWDEITLSADEYNAKLLSQVELNDKDIESMRKSQTEEDAMLERLKELSKRQDKTIEEKNEAARIAEILTGKYGKLGISINDLTEDYNTLLEAQKKVNDAQNTERAEALANQVETLGKAIDESVKKGMVGGFGKQAWGFLKSTLGFGSPLSGEDRYNYFKSLSVEDRLGYARSMLNPDYEFGAKTDADIAFWKAQEAELVKLNDLTKRLNTLREASAETQKDELKTLQEESDASRDALEEEKSAWEARVAELNEEAKLQEEMDKKHGDALAKQLEQEEKIAEAMKKGIEQRRIADIAGIGFSALRKSGRGFEADWREAVYEESMARGESLDDASIADIKKRVRMRRALDSLSIASPLDYTPRVNSLIARGGSSEAMKMPKVEDLQNRTLSSVTRIQQITSRILSNIDEMTTT